MIPKGQTLEQWLDQVANRNSPTSYGFLLYHTLQRIITPRSDLALNPLPEPITYRYTANRAFEVAYWKTIARLATGRFINKDNADCVRDPATQQRLKHRTARPGCPGGLAAGLLPKADRAPRDARQGPGGRFAFPVADRFRLPLDGRLAGQQEGTLEERNLLVMIPGKDRSRAVIMADHYDTAYMEDLYYKEQGGNLARMAAAGADDNYSATAALMLAAPIFLKLSREGKLDCDVWLVHLTGEEFPCGLHGCAPPGAVAGRGRSSCIHPGKKALDLSEVRIEGVYVMDMIAHNRDRDRDVFQISPGLSRQSVGWPTRRTWPT